MDIDEGTQYIKLMSGKCVKRLIHKRYIDNKNLIRK